MVVELTFDFTMFVLSFLPSFYLLVFFSTPAQNGGLSFINRALLYDSHNSWGTTLVGNRRRQYTAVSSI